MFIGWQVDTAMMFEGGLAFSFIDLAIGLVTLVLGLYVFLRNPYLRLSKLFLAVTALYSVAAIAAFLMLNSPDKGWALPWARLMALAIVGAFSVQFYLITVLPIERNPRLLSDHKIPYAALVLVGAALTLVAVQDVELTSFGYRVQAGLGPTVLLGTAAIFAIASISLILTIYERSTPEVRYLVLLLSIGVSLPLLFMAIAAVFETGGGSLPSIFPLGFLLSTTVFLYAIIRQDLFQFKPPLPEVKAPTVNVQADAGVDGKCLLIEGKRPDRAYLMLLDRLEAGKRGLLITRLHPDRLREDYGLVKVPMIWLATQPGPDRIDPTSLTILQHTIVDFLQKGPPSVILLDGLEYLMSENQSDKVLRIIYTLLDTVTISNSQLLVPLDPEVLEIKDLAKLEREFEIIRTEGAGSEI